MYDVAVIGAGVIGCAIARELSKYDADICVIEREEDVCCGTSKANSAIIHAGFDAVPGTLKARLNVAGNAMMDDLARDLDIPFTRNGSLVVCTKDQDSDGLNTLLARGRANGVTGLRILNETEAKEMEPNLSDAVSCALYAPTGGIVCPFHFTIALAENAWANGVTFFLNNAVTAITKKDGYYEITTDRQTLQSRAIVNAAGVYADVISAMASRDPIHITARKGEYCLLDKSAVPKPFPIVLTHSTVFHPYISAESRRRKQQNGELPSHPPQTQQKIAPLMIALALTEVGTQTIL